MWPFDTSAKNKEKIRKQNKRRVWTNIIIGSTCALIFAGAGVGIGYVVFPKTTPEEVNIVSNKTKYISVYVEGTCQVQTSKKALIKVTGHNGVDLHHLAIPSEPNSNLIFGGWTYYSDEEADIDVKWNGGIAQEYQIAIDCGQDSNATCQIVVEPEKPTATDIIVYGSNILTGTSGFSGKSQYSAKDNLGHSIKNEIWKIVDDGKKIIGITINSLSGELFWDGTASSCTFEVKCEGDGLIAGQMTVNLKITAAASVVVYGSDILTGTSGFSGTSQYSAKDNLGNSINNVTWSVAAIQDPITGIQINTSGKLIWDQTASSCAFNVKCEKDGLSSGIMKVQLNITTPTATSVVIDGPSNISAQSGTTGSVEYTATDNLGGNISSPIWSIDGTSPKGVSIDPSSGVLSYTGQAFSCIFTIKCATTGLLTTGTLDVNLTVNTQSIIITGPNAINATEGTAGNTTPYTAKDNSGNAISNGSWSIAEPSSGTPATGVSIDSSGKVSWTADATSGSFVIQCTKDTLIMGTLEVSLTSVGTISHLTTNDGNTYNFDANQGNFMTDRPDDLADFNFIDDGGTSQNIDRTTITSIKITNLNTIPLATANYGRNLCYGMTNLTYADIQLPKTITAVGEHFCHSMFNGCEKLVSLPSSFQLPQGITNNAGDYFCEHMFFNCGLLTSLPRYFQLPQAIQSVGKNFCRAMFQNCYALASLPLSFQLPQSINLTGDDFCAEMFRKCEALTSGGPNNTSLIFPNLSISSGNFANNCFLDSNVNWNPTADPGDSVPIHRS